MRPVLLLTPDCTLYMNVGKQGFDQITRDLDDRGPDNEGSTELVQAIYILMNLDLSYNIKCGFNIFGLKSFYHQKCRLYSMKKHFHLNNTGTQYWPSNSVIAALSFTVFIQIPEIFMHMINTYVRSTDITITIPRGHSGEV